MERLKRLLTVFVMLSGAIGWSAAAHAQAPRRSHEFQFRFGGYFPSTDGSFWQDTEDTFTLHSSDFNDFAFGFTFLAPLDNRLELGFNLDFYDQTVRSSYRDFVDQGGFPILHDSTLEMLPASVDLRFLPTGRYAIRGGSTQRRVLHPVPYFGGGIGVLFWNYEEVGDFLDFDTVPNEPPFFSRFVDDGTAFEAHVLAGVELPMGPDWTFLFEGRYMWAEDDLGGDFAGLGSLDLGGFYGYVGFAFRF